MTADAVGGVWTYALDLARALSRKGVRILLATMGPRPSESQRLEARAIQGLELHTSDFALEWQIEPWQDLALAGAWLLALERQFEPDIVHVNGYIHGALPWKVPVLVVCHSCVASWWQAVHGEMPPHEWDRYRYEVRKGLHVADHVVAPTWAMLASIRELYGDLTSDEVIPNGRDASLYHPEPKEESIVAVGRCWDEGKNVRALASIAGQLEWPVSIAGEGAPGDASVHWLGHQSQEDVARLLNRAAIFAHPAKYEPFGLSVLEAAMAGCALVLGDIPSLRENWSGAALFVPPDEPDSLRVAIQSLIHEPSALREMSEKARTQAAAFSIERACNRYLTSYELLLQRRRMPVLTS